MNLPHPMGVIRREVLVRDIFDCIPHVSGGESREALDDLC